MTMMMPGVTKSNTELNLRTKYYPQGDANCQLYLPLYDWDLRDSPFDSKDKNATVCTVTGALWQPHSPGYYFDGGDDLIDLGDPAALRLTTNITIIAWVKRAAVGAVQEICGNRRNSATTGGYHLFFYSDNKIYFQGNGNSGANTAFNFSTTNTYTSTSKFYHIFAYFDSAVGAYLVIDGVADGSDVTVAAVNGQGNNFFVGVDSNDGTTGNMNGIIGEVIVYNATKSVAFGEEHRLATKWRYGL